MKRISSIVIVFFMLSFSASTLSAQKSCAFVIHVDKATGNDSDTCGGENSPCATIQKGINRAVLKGDTLVRIRAGVYNEVVEFAGGINLWGGFNSNWKSGDTTTILGGLNANGEYITISADSINQTTLISDLKILGPDAATAGKSTYGVHLNQSTGLIFQRCIIAGGKGAPGENGKNGVDATKKGDTGGMGGNSAQYSVFCDNTSCGKGGVGRINSGISSTMGGIGGNGGLMDLDCSLGGSKVATVGNVGYNAFSYVSNSYGYRGYGGPLCLQGGAGNDGQTVHGKGGTGATNASQFSGNFWAATRGSDGTLGAHGTGGGGGGGSGGCDNGTDSYGAGGGGGGSGGLASLDSGRGGLSGGNSAAVFLQNSSCKFINCEIRMGIGGQGGNGGNSGLGAVGGPGGAGGLGSGTGAGGKGGKGGDGGNSGAGGGGAGGSVYGIFGNNSDVIFNGIYSGGIPGNPGFGGSGSPVGVEGKPGSVGILANTGGSLNINDSSLSVINDPCQPVSGIHNQSPSDFSVYPNPFQDQITITSSKIPEEIDILDCWGRRVFKEIPNSEETKIFTRDFPAGLYFLRVGIHTVIIVRD